MKFYRDLMMALVGLALLAAPITAAAKDNDRGGNDSHQVQAQSHESHADAHHGDAGNHPNGRDQHEARSENQGAGAPAMERHENRENHNEARDNREDNRNAFREQRNVRSETHSVAPESRQEYRGQRETRGYNPAPAVTERRDVREDRREGARDRDHDNDRWNRQGHERWIYGDRGRDYDLAFDPDYDREYASGWVMPYSYRGGACAWARHLRAVYRHDEYTGHPAAAESLLWQLHRAERRCGAARYGYNSYRYRY